MSSGRFLLISPSGTSAPACSESLPRLPESAAAARRMVRTALDVWHLPMLVDGASLVVTELVANAVDHARGSCIRVTVTRTGETGVRIAVVDKDRKRPDLRPATPDDERGRGLWLVDAVSEVWGVDPLPWGKRVWAELGPLEAEPGE